MLFTAYPQNTLYYKSDGILFEKGLDLIEKKHYAGAQKFFETYLEKKPNSLKSIEAEYYVAYCALYLDQERGIPMLIEWQRKHKKHPKASFVFYELGKYYYSKGDHKDAAKWLKQVDINEIDNRLERYEVQFSLGYSYFVLKDIDNAEKQFDQIKKYNHNYTYAANYYSGYIKFKKKDYQQSLRDFEVAGDNDLYAKVVPFMIINIHYQLGDYKKVIDYADKVLLEKKGGSKTADIILLAAESEFNLEKYEDAYERYKQVMGRSSISDDRDVLYRYGYTALKSEKYDDASFAFEKVSSTSDSLGQYALYYLGYANLKLEKYTEAILAYKSASSVDFNEEIKGSSLYSLGKLQYERGYFNDAVKTLRAYKKLFPSSEYIDNVNEITAEGLLYSDDLDEAIKYIESVSVRSNRIEKAYQQVTYLKGIQSFNKRDYKSAKNYFKKSIDHAKDDEYLAKAHFWRGESKSILHLWEEASWDYAKVFKLTSSSSIYYVRSLYGIAYAYFNQQKFTEARLKFEAYKKTVERTDEKKYLSDVLVRLADCYFKEKKYDQSIKLYKEALDQKVKSSDYVLFQLGKVYGVKSDFSKAYEYYDLVITDYPSSIHQNKALLEKAKLSFSAKQYDKTIAFCSDFIKKAPNHQLIPEAYLIRAISFNNQKQYGEARDDYAYIIDEHCRSREAKVAISKLDNVYSKLDKSEGYDKYLDAYASCADGESVENIYFSRAEGEFNRFQLDEAIQSFEKYLSKYPSSHQKELTYYYLGQSYFYLEKQDSARAYYQLYMNSSHTKYQEVVRVNLYTSYFQAKEYQKAIPVAISALELVEDILVQIPIYADLMESYYELDQYDSSLIYAEKILQTENKVVWASTKAELVKAKIAFANGDKKSARNGFKNVIDQSSDESGAEAYYYLGELLYADSLYDTSIDTLIALQKKFTTYPEWSGRGSLLIAQNFKTKNQLNNAIQVLESLANYPNEEVKREAQELLTQYKNDTKKPEKSQVEEIPVEQNEIIEDNSNNKLPSNE